MKEVVVKLTDEPVSLSLFKSEDIAIEREILPHKAGHSEEGVGHFIVVKGYGGDVLVPNELWLNPDSVDYIHIRPIVEK